MTFFDNFASNQLIAAHRGFRSYFPENTLAAFTASIGKCDFIEVNIQLSKDNVPVVIHDQTLSRTSDCEHKKQQFGLDSIKVGDWTVPELKALDVASWFLETDPFSTITDKKVSLKELKLIIPQRIMTLEEILYHPKLKKIPVNLEIKDHSGTPQDKLVTARVLEVIKMTRSESRVLISSFNHDYLLMCHIIYPSISTGALQKEDHPPDIIDYLYTLGVAAYHPADSITDRSLIRQLRAAGFGVNVFTVNNKKRQKFLFNAGATAIFTDFPELN
ncbi:MAG: glycerophosphodiester phosphodiesterase [Deltaproteobacteria bacterium]|nr:glycerophosphodiester phosphodiesterase [Deltaproteobacteria bacterium]MBW2659560.1 glycerophosphodiester phosphodiesterase [Deltaproteobacteria bacterium]